MAFRFSRASRPDEIAGFGHASDGTVLLHFARTVAGDAEFEIAALELPAAARALLHRTDGAMSVDECLANEPGSRLADVVSLVPLGLIRTRSCIAMSRQAPLGVQLQPLIDAVLALSADDAYFVLTNQAKLRLGLIHGFRLVLELERCVGPHEVRALALRFIESIWRAHGEAGIRQFHRYLSS